MLPGNLLIVDGHREIREIEIAQLDLRYAHTRIERPKESLALAASLERTGQIVPVIVTKAFVLLDGYLRVMAMKHCGLDTVRAEIWYCTEEEALVEILARAHGRKWDAIEEAALVRELHDHYHLSQAGIASRVGRTQGWVSGRLALFGALSEDIMELIRKGSISTWTATRVIVPIARAIPEHGKALSESLSKTSLSTREMAHFFEHYQKANRRQRDHMVHDPVLFVKSLHAREEASRANVLKEGPEGIGLLGACRCCFNCCSGRFGERNGQLLRRGEKDRSSGTARESSAVCSRRSDGEKRPKRRILRISNVCAIHETAEPESKVSPAHVARGRSQRSNVGNNSRWEAWVVLAVP